MMKILALTLMLAMLLNAGQCYPENSNALTMVQKCFVALKMGTLDEDRTFLCKALVKVFLLERSNNYETQKSPERQQNNQVNKV